MNTYAYVDGAPIARADPQGLDWIESVRSWWSGSLAAFQADSAADTGLRILQSLPADGAVLASFGLITRIGSARQCIARGEAGRFADLAVRAVKGDKLTPHHMPQAAAGFTNRADGGALVLSEAEHQLTRTYGFKGALTAEQEASMAFRDVLARDIRDVRTISRSQYNQGLRDLLDYYRTNFPELMLKK